MRLIGVLASEHIASGLVAGHRLAGPVVKYPSNSSEVDCLDHMPADEILRAIQQEVLTLAGGEPVDAVGVGVPGIVRDGVMLEAPNLPQIKGLDIRGRLTEMLGTNHVLVLNDADAMAAGVAASRDHLDRLVRVWMLGTGIGYGRYPQLEGMWEGGHCAVTLDPTERYCGCGGVGHLEGVMGYRAMRLRFLDLEPEEVFEQAREGDERCRDFVKLWHRALAAATGSSIHLDGPGKFYITGPMARFVDSDLLNSYLQETVRMSSLQGSFVEVVITTDDVAVIGAAVDAGQAFPKPVVNGVR
ncbi:MAG: ROK family protein [Bryobacteraceae bacterium]